MVVSSLGSGSPSGTVQPPIVVSAVLETLSKSLFTPSPLPASDCHGRTVCAPQEAWSPLGPWLLLCLLSKEVAVSWDSKATGRILVLEDMGLFWSFWQPF